MLEALRTLLLTGVGAIDLTDEKARQVVDELTRRGGLAADEARELATLWATGARERRDAIAARIREGVDEALARHNVASHASVAALQARIDALQGRVDALEQVVARLSEPTVEP